MKPLLKWVGGKTQIIDDIIKHFPQEMEHYHEIFLGGGSVLLKLLELRESGDIYIKKNIYAYDANVDLINLYKHVQTNSHELYESINKFMTEYDNINGDKINRKPTNIEEAKTSKKSYYYWMRYLYNTIDKNTIDCSALFIILNKLCFRGLYRTGPNGFNVPYGHYKKTPTIIDKLHLDNVSIAIKDVKFICCDFTESLKNCKENDFVYLDPPYVPEISTSFVNYTSDGFNIEKHQQLFQIMKELNGVKFTMSNSNTSLVKEAFSQTNVYSIEEIKCRRAINSKNPESTTIEVIIKN